MKIIPRLKTFHCLPAHWALHFGFPDREARRFHSSHSGSVPSCSSSKLHSPFSAFLDLRWLAAFHPGVTCWDSASLMIQEDPLPVTLPRSYDFLYCLPSDFSIECPVSPWAVYRRSFVASLLMYERGHCQHVVGTQVGVERVGVPNVVERIFLVGFFFCVNCLCLHLSFGRHLLFYRFERTAYIASFFWYRLHLFP